MASSGVKSVLLKKEGRRVEAYHYLKTDFDQEEIQ